MLQSKDMKLLATIRHKACSENVPFRPTGFAPAVDRSILPREKRSKMGLENRLAVEEFTTLARGIILRGYYKPGGDSGAGLRRLMILSAPSLYPYAADPDRIDIQAMRYVLQRLPDRIWAIRDFTVARSISPMTARDFAPVATAARRRPTFRTGPDSLVTSFRGGMSDLLDFISAMTCYQIETDKIREKAGACLRREEGGVRGPSLWERLSEPAAGDARNSILHALSVEFRCGYDEIRELDDLIGGNLPEFVSTVVRTDSRALKVTFTDRFGLVGNYNRKAKLWAAAVADAVSGAGRVHLVSSNRHSLANLLSPWVAARVRDGSDMNQVRKMMEDPESQRERELADQEAGIGAVRVPDDTPSCQTVRTGDSAVILNMDYAFGEEGFFLFNELCETLGGKLGSVFIIGKAGTLTGSRGDIMLPTYFVKQGTGDVYPVDNCLAPCDFPDDLPFRVIRGGPMLTVDGTFMQNRDVLSYFRDNWKALGVEMEGIPYVRALAQAVLRGRIPGGLPIGVAYYASDAPLEGDTLSVPLGDAGVVPVYSATRAVLTRIGRMG